MKLINTIDININFCASDILYTIRRNTYLPIRINLNRDIKDVINFAVGQIVMPNNL